MALIWRMRAPNALSWREWGGESVVFDANSGSTHRLDIVAGHALKRVADGPADTATLTAAIADYLEVSPDGELAALVDDLLSRLAQLGLIEVDR